LIRLIDRFLMFYVRTADRLQRTAGWIEAMDGGLDHLREVIVDDSLGICADLEAAMARHVESYRDEWRGVLEDKEKLTRFTSFVNAPGIPDPTISFREERGQRVPLGMPELRAHGDRGRAGGLPEEPFSQSDSGRMTMQGDALSPHPELNTVVGR
jgi:nitrite reductase (NADH) large subunit